MRAGARRDPGRRDEPDAPILGYGGIATWPDTTVTCVLERFGVTCVNPASGQGYFLARGRYQLF